MAFTLNADLIKHKGWPWVATSSAAMWGNEVEILLTLTQAITQLVSYCLCSGLFQCCS